MVTLSSCTEYERSWNCWSYITLMPVANCETIQAGVGGLVQSRDLHPQKANDPTRRRFVRWAIAFDLRRLK